MPDDYGILTNPATQDQSQPTPAAPAQGQQGPAPQVQSDTGADQVQIPQQSAQGAITVPPRPAKRGGLAGIVDEMRDALAGTTKPQIYTDANGNQTEITPPMSHGEQWARIAGEGIRGAAAGLVNGQGPNGAGRALAAGVVEADRAKDKEKSDLQDQKQQGMQDTLNRFNIIKLQHDTAANEFALQRMKVTAQQQDVQFSEGQIQREKDLHSADLGTYTDAADLSRVQQQVPDFWKKVYAGEIRQVPDIAADGSRLGVHLFMRMPGIGDQVVPAGSKVLQFVPGEKPNDPPTLAYRTLSSQSTNDQVDAYNSSAWKQYQEYFKNDADIQAKKADVKEKDANASVKPSEIVKNRAEANKANAEAGKASAEAAATLRGPAVSIPSSATLDSLPAPIQASIKGLLDYSVDPKTFPSRVTAKSGQMDSATAIGIAKMIDPSYDEKEFPSRSKLRFSFTSGRDADNIKSLNTSISHLNNLAGDINALHNGSLTGMNWAGNLLSKHTGDPAVTNFNTDANAVTSELSALFKGTGAATDQEIKAWREQLSTSESPQQLWDGVRKAITLMGGRMQALNNKWNEGMKSPRAFQLLSPESQKILQQLNATSLIAMDQEGMSRTGHPAQPPAQADPQTHVFSKGAWQKSHPGQDVNAAVAAAVQQKYQVVD